MSGGDKAKAAPGGALGHGLTGPAGAAAVRAAAAAARVRLDPADVTEVAAGLARRSAVLAALRDVRPDARTAAVGVGAGGMPLRADAGPPYALARPVSEFVADARAGYVLLAWPGGPAPDDAPGENLVADDALAAELEANA